MLERKCLCRQKKIHPLFVFHIFIIIIILLEEDHTHGEAPVVFILLMGPRRVYDLLHCIFDTGDLVGLMSFTRSPNNGCDIISLRTSQALMVVALDFFVNGPISIPVIV